MRELKNREVIAGFILLILLSMIAMILIVKKEVTKDQKKNNTEVVVEAQESKLPDDATFAVEEEKIADEQTEGTVAAPVQNVASQDTTADTATPKISKKTTSKGFYKKATMREYKQDDSQMAELFGYWDAYKLDAVDDLIRLDRVRTLTDSLKGTNEYYYYGEVDSNGQPSGRGLAIYADNTYYCGDFKNGLREGSGMWMKIYLKNAVTINGMSGITAHSYNGEFKNDLPNGQGQEHYDYDFSLMKVGYNIANVIGNFADGYYDGEDLYIMTVSSENSSDDWEVDANKGTFIPFENNKNSQGKDPVWENMDDDDENHIHWMSAEENQGWGIYDLKK